MVARSAAAAANGNLCNKHKQLTDATTENGTAGTERSADFQVMVCLLPSALRG